jgi:deazaflavin-dependent oxidoreductase (nitroreductase family)
MKQLDRRAMQFLWRAHKLVWNWSGGRLGGKILGLPVLELITLGHKSGRERQILINYFDDDGNPAIIGTNAGKDTDPAWVKNLRANPQARARWDGKWHDVTGVEVDGDDHDRVWEQAAAASNAYADYAKVLTRPIPIIRLEPR